MTGRGTNPIFTLVRGLELRSEEGGSFLACPVELGNVVLRLCGEITNRRLQQITITSFCLHYGAL